MQLRDVRFVPIADIIGQADHFGLGISICIGMSAGVSMLWAADRRSFSECLGWR